METNEVLERVKAFADRAHGDQMRRYSADRYIVHPVRVMETTADYNNDTTVLAAALLHDVLEDTHTTASEVRDFLSTIMSPEDVDKTLKYVNELTDVYIKEDYPSMNRRWRRGKEAERLATASPEAQTIKYADILDNSIDISENDPGFALVYLRESKDMLRQLDKGNPLLRQRVVQEVDDRLKQYFSKANITSL